MRGFRAELVQRFTAVPRVALERSEFVLVLFVTCIAMLIVSWLVMSLVRRNRAQRRATGTQRHVLAYWFLAPTALACMYALDSHALLVLTVPPSDALTIRGTAHQGAWSFLYAGSKQETNRLVVPVGLPVRLVLSSSDVGHGFCIPRYDVRNEARVGRFSSLWFTATELGESPIRCKSSVFAHEPTAANRRDMQPNVRLTVLTPTAFETWLQNADAPGARP